MTQSHHPLPHSLRSRRCGVPPISRDGYLVIPACSHRRDRDLTATTERELPSREALTKADQAGNKVSLKMWNGAGDDVYGMFSRNERVVNTPSS